MNRRSAIARFRLATDSLNHAFEKVRLLISKRSLELDDLMTSIKCSRFEIKNLRHLVRKKVIVKRG